MAKKSLLELALEKNRNKREPKSITPEEIELALAWMDNKVALIQASYAMELTPGNTVIRFAYALREAYKSGILTVKNKEE